MTALVIAFLCVGRALAAEKVFVFGMPKAGTTSIASFFECGGLRASHWMCRNETSEFRCGLCIRDNVTNGRRLLHGCGDYDVWAEMNQDDMPPCFFPQIEAIDLIHEEYPNSVWILNLRPVQHWIESVDRWNTMRQRLINCDISTLPAGVGATDDELKDWFMGHTERVLRFAQWHPTHLLIMLDVESEYAGMRLHRHFPEIPSSCWSKENANP